MATDHSILLDVKDLEVVFDGKTILKNVSFSLKDGDVLAIVGPNGAGKSTVLRALLGLIKYEGSVNWRENIRIGYVPQKLSIEKNMPMTVREFMNLKNSSEAQIHQSLKAVGVSLELLDHALGLLSGGELQRVLIAWALLGDPNVLLFDEPTSGIDIGGEETIYNLLHQIQDSQKLSLILISHDLNIVYQYANNVLCLNREMICYGVPRDVLDPESLVKLYGGGAKFFMHEHEEVHDHHDH